MLLKDGVMEAKGSTQAKILAAEPLSDCLASLGGAAALVVGLWRRPCERGLGDALIIVGAALAAIWFWTVVMTPIAMVVIVGVLFDRVRARSRSAEAQEARVSASDHERPFKQHS